MYNFKRIGMNEVEIVKELFISVFTIEPWNDDWSNQEQLDLYLSDLIGQSNSLTYGLFENEKMIAEYNGQVYVEEYEEGIVEKDGELYQEVEETVDGLWGGHVNRYVVTETPESEIRAWVEAKQAEQNRS